MQVTARNASGKGDPSDDPGDAAEDDKGHRSSKTGSGGDGDRRALPRPRGNSTYRGPR